MTNPGWEIPCAKLNVGRVTSGVKRPSRECPISHQSWSSPLKTASGWILRRISRERDASTMFWYCVPLLSRISCLDSLASPHKVASGLKRGTWVKSIRGSLAFSIFFHSCIFHARRETAKEQKDILISSVVMIIHHIFLSPVGPMQLTTLIFLSISLPCPNLERKT